MASMMMMMTSLSAVQLLQLESRVRVCSSWDNTSAIHGPTSIKSYFRQHDFSQRTLLVSNPHIRGLRRLPGPLSATGSGLEASITDEDVKTIALKNVKIAIESQSENQMQVRVDVTGEETQKVFNMVLTNLARTAPPIPGFRREKGGKTTKVPKDFLLQMLGEERVTKFVIQEIVTSSMTDYVKKENLMVKDKKMSTTQTVEELRSLFRPGNDFGFNAILELENSEGEDQSTSSDDPVS
ncbi:hypothetical protein SAY86_000715 [Trapa natans]|uniref:peptidylprolyl isomerase n=1 Tax=Trapa natans TaxID=22666 RepID=A0AAN7MCI6_TRANT|nr:hypothetical protein SAY86_000715 [Trapa natans]